MAIVLVVVLLSVALITRVDGDFSNTNLETKTQQARALAQSGVADALFQIDQQGASPSSLCDEPNSSTFTVLAITTTNGSPTATVASGGFPGVLAGQSVSGTGLAAGTMVRSVSGNVLTLTQNATTTATRTFTFNLCFASIPNAPGAVYTARYTPPTGGTPGHYTVLSKGTVKNISYAVQATVTNQPVIVDAVTGGTVTFNGNSSTDVHVTDPYGRCIEANDGSTTYPSCSGSNPGATVGIGVTKGGTLTCHGPGDPNATYVNYGGTISGCSLNPLNLGPIYFPQPPSPTCPPPFNPYGAPPTPCMLPLTTATPPGPTQPCANVSPGNVTASGGGYTVTGGAGVKLEPGIFSCPGGLTMTNTINIDYGQTPLQNGGRVQIYVFPAASSPTTSPTVTVSGATINACQTSGSGVGPYEPATCNGGLVGDPVDLQIYAGGGTSNGTANLGNSNVNAIFWGPTMDTTFHGASDSLTWTGSLVLGNMTANGSVSFSLNFDERIESEFQVASWQISNYLQTSPNFSIP